MTNASLTRRDLLADSSAVLTTACGEFGCRTELFTPVSHLTHWHLLMFCSPSCNFRCNVPKSGGCSSRRILNTLKRLLEEPRGTNTRAFAARSNIPEGVRTTRYVSGVLV